MRVDFIRHAGGVNSLENFARSWTRAAGFLEIAPSHPSFVYADDADDGHGHQFRRTPDEERRVTDRTSLLGAQLQREATTEQAIDDCAITEGEGITEPQDKKPPNVRRDEILLAIPPNLGTPLVGSFGTSYGTVSSRLNESSMRHAARMWREQQASQEQVPDREPILVKRVEQEGHIVDVIIGQSTLPQTVFNCTNVLIGVGLLSLPLGIKYAGWLIGMLFLFLSAVVTSYTARLLAKCMQLDGNLLSFADLAYISYGPKAKVVTMILFTLELLATNVALIILFSDSLEALLPGIGEVQWKIICGVILIPLTFLPLSFLGFTSFLGIVSCLGSKYRRLLYLQDPFALTRNKVVVIVFADGLIKPHGPGSLLEPAKTYLFPDHWITLPLSFGLLMCMY
jgi:vesicular inhibitory amino acid transporter